MILSPLGLSTAPLAVQADADVVLQVLENLISNAVKYSPQRKNIFVRLEQDAQSVRVKVQDEGPRLIVEDQKKLFGKFARLRAKPASTRPASTAERAPSTVGNGTTFGDTAVQRFKRSSHLRP